MHQSFPGFLIHLLATHGYFYASWRTIIVQPRWGCCRNGAPLTPPAGGLLLFNPVGVVVGLGRLLPRIAIRGYYCSTPLGLLTERDAPYPGFHPELLMFNPVGVVDGTGRPLPRIAIRGYYCSTPLGLWTERDASYPGFHPELLLFNPVGVVYGTVSLIPRWSC